MTRILTAFAVLILISLSAACHMPIYNRVYTAEVPDGIRDEFLFDREHKGAYGYWPDTHRVGASYILLTVGREERFDSVIIIHSVEYERVNRIAIVVAEERDVTELEGGYDPDDWFFLLRFEIPIRDVVVVYPNGQPWY